MSEADPTIDELIARLVKLEGERAELVAENTRQREQILRMIARKEANSADPQQEVKNDPSIRLKHKPKTIQDA